MGRNPGVRFSPIPSNSQSYGQGNKRESLNCISNTTVADEALVPSPTPVVHSQSSSNSSVIRCVTHSSGETPSFSHSKQFVSSGMESFRSNLIGRGISIEAASFIENFEEKELGQIITRPGQSGMAGIINSKLIH